MLSSDAYRLLDVGGTFIKCADGRQIPISSDGSAEVIADAIRKAIGPTDGLKGIGVAIPGPFDYKEGIFMMDHKFASVKGQSFHSLAGLPSSFPIKFHHDVNVLLRGAIRMLGLYKQNSALVTIGTGLGFTYAIHGAVQYNALGSPAIHLWNKPYNGGILEDVVSARGIRIAYARKSGDGTQSAYGVAQKAYAGNADAIAVFENVGTLIGQAVKEATKYIPLQTLFIGGQIGKSLSLMLPKMQAVLDGVKIEPAPADAVFEGLSSLFELNE